ncbi:S8 family serine peptidase [Catellatospora citrea]|uniref:S8 family serine peptidase n=1 Tax=Catellatospora citrea TaxID=53366 RepID=UPI0014775E63|nr:S8 family serine peptidase [Catellatospora citrea]
MVVLVVGVACFLASSSPAAGAGDQPPPLPSGTDRCVGASPVVSSEPSWAALQMAPSLAWPLARGNGVVVAVVDSGVSSAAPALAGAVKQGADVVKGGRADSDCQGRGTALAGIVAARPVRGSAVVGMAPEATVLPVRITDERGGIPDGSLAKGIKAAVENGARVILVGTGTTKPDSDLRAAVEEAVAHDVVVVAAAGTEAESGKAWYPAAYDSVLAVSGMSGAGAPTATGSRDARVDLLAPATDVVTIAPVGAGHYRVGGTAVAAAYAAGTAALVRSYLPELTQDQVRQRLRLTAEQLPGTAGPGTGGAGMLDPYAAVSATAPEQRTQPVGSAPRPVALPSAPPADPTVGAAAAIAAGMAVAAGVVFVVVFTVTRGRRRRVRR